jgi:uncharacterized protein YegP (UPF0339 family)
MAKYQIHKSSNGGYHFLLRSDNGEIILTSSEGYISKSSCRNAIEMSRIVGVLDQNYDKRVSSNGKYYFVLKGGNGSILGVSNQYESMAGRDYGIVSVKRNAAIAALE